MAGKNASEARGPNPHHRAAQKLHDAAWAPVLVAVVGCFTAIVSPVMVGALIATGRSASVAGAYLFVELAGCFAGALCAIPLAHRWSWRSIGIVGCACFSLANGLSAALLQSATLLALRAIAGLAAGFAYGAGYAVAARSSQPTRDFARMVLLQLIITAVSVYGIPVMDKAQDAGLAFLVMAALALSGVAAARGIPRAVPAPEKFGEPTWDRAWWWSVMTVFLNFCAYGAVWAFAEPLGLRSGATPAILATSLAVSALCGGLGAALAEFASMRIGSRLPLIWSFGLAVMSFIMLAPKTNPWLFAVAISAFQLSWTSGIPFLLGLISSRSSQSAVVACSAVELAGVAVGPGMAALIVDRAGTSSVVFLGSVLLLAYGIGVRNVAKLKPRVNLSIDAAVGTAS